MNMLFSMVIFFCGFWKFMFNKKNIMISLLSLEVMGISCFLVVLFEMNNYMFMYFFFMCFMVSGSSIGLSLLVLLSLNMSKNFISSTKLVLC